MSFVAGEQVRRRILAAVFAAIDDVNELLPPELQLEKHPSTAILGEGGSLDSMGFVNFVAGLETHIERELGHAVRLVETAAREPGERFRTVESIVAHISHLVGDPPAYQRGS